MNSKNAMLYSSKDAMNSKECQTLVEIEDRLRHKKNIVISGISEEMVGSIEDRAKSDFSKVKVLLQNLPNIAENGITRISRLGRQQPDKTRLLRVSFSDEDATKTILDNAKVLKEIPTYKSVYINPDRTRQQQENNKRLREELKKDVLWVKTSLYVQAR